MVLRGMRRERLLTRTRFSAPLSARRSISPIYNLHHLLGITRAGGERWRYHFVDPAQVVRDQPHLERGDVFFKILAPLRSRDGDDVFALCQHPREQKLRRFASLLFGNFLDAANQVQVLLEILALEPRRAAAEVVSRQVLK